MASTSPQKLKIAIIGGGIAGLSLLFGLLKQPHLDPKLYEGGPEIAGDEGAGVGLSINALRASEIIDPGLREAVARADAVHVSQPIAKLMMVLVGFKLHGIQLMFIDREMKGIPTTGKRCLELQLRARKRVGFCSSARGLLVSSSNLYRRPRA